MPDPARPPVVNIEDVLADPDLTDVNPERGAFAARFAFIGRALGTDKIGVNLTVVPPGKKAWPRHYHFVNDEMFVVLAGTGVLHYGEQDWPLRPLDVVHIRAGTGIPFQIENTGAQEMRYLAFSTMLPADVFHYPDSDKLGVMANRTPFRSLGATDDIRLAQWLWAGSKVGYWEGEPEAGDAGAVVTPRPGEGG